MTKSDTATTSLKVRDLKINIKSNFLAEKRLDDILYSIANVKLKEKTA